MNFDYILETITPENTGMITIGGVQGIELPASTTANRPGSPATGTYRFNTSLGFMEYWNGTTWVSGGTVTSVALADGSTAPIYTISGSPVNGTGTLTFTLNTQNANTSFMGPTSGGAAQPGFRALVTADISSIAVTAAVAGTGIGVSGAQGSVTFSNTGVTSIAGTTNQITASASTGAVTLSIPTGFIAPGSVTATTYFADSTTNSISAAGTTLATATVLTNDFNVVTSVASGAGVAMPTPVAGRTITVVNRGANALKVYPSAAGVTIDGLAAGTAVTVPAGQVYSAVGITTTQMYSIDQTQAAGTGLSISYTNGVVTYSNAGVASFETSLSGLTPTTATTGAVTLAGTLGVTSGGTGTTTAPTTGQLLIATSATAYTPYTVATGTGIGTTSVGTTFTINNTGVTSAVAGTGIGVSAATGAVTITNDGVTSITGTTNEITVSASTGAVTLSVPTTFVAPGSVEVTTSFQTSATNTISSAGTTQGTATALTTDYNVVSTVAAGSGVVLPAGLAGNRITIVNNGANALLVYPASGASIDGNATNAAVSILPSSVYETEAISSTQWWSIDDPNSLAIRTLTYLATSLDSPNNADWAVNNLAATIMDPTNNAITVRQFGIDAQVTGSITTTKFTVTAVASGSISVDDYLSGANVTAGTQITAIPTINLTGVAITGTAGQFSCTNPGAANPLAIGQTVTISGNKTGGGTITGYVNPTTYYIVATNGTTTFTLSATPGGAGITTTAGTPTGLTYGDQATGGIGAYTVGTSQTAASATVTVVTESGVGFTTSIPAGASYMTFTFKGHGAAVGSGSAVNVNLRMYTRQITAATPAAVAAWSTALSLTALATSTANTYWNTYTQTIALSAFPTALVAGQLYQFELTRTAGTNSLANSWLLGELTVQFS